MSDLVRSVLDRIGELPLPLQLSLLIVAIPIAATSLLPILLFLRIGSRVLAVHVLHNDLYDNLPRPPVNSWLFPLWGHIGTIRNAKPAEAFQEWIKELDTSVFVFRGLLYAPRLMLADTRAMNYILGQEQSYDYPKPEESRKFLLELLGNGLLVAEGDTHKRQRRILQPAFSISAIRNLTPTFFKHANLLADTLTKMVDSTEGPAKVPFLSGQSVLSAKESTKGKPVFDVSFWLSKATLDIIGDAGFDYRFDSLANSDGEGDELSATFGNMMKNSVSLTPLLLLQLALQNIPGLMWMRKLPTKRRRTILATHSILQKASGRIIQRKKREIQEEFQGQNLSLQDEKSFFEEGAKSKDLLYLMMKANMAKDVKTSEKMDDAELLGQMTTLLLAGHETTGTLATWLLHVLSLPENQHIQEKLRQEIEDTFAGRDELDYDGLMAMPCLDMVTKEILRFCSPVTATVRTASRDDVVPLSKPYKTRNGESTFNSVVVKKGQEILIPVQVINKLESIWGPTAAQFDPERWREIPESAKATGMPLQLLSFLEGPRGCIGSRFAICEFKAIICSVLRSLKFEAVEGWEVEPKQGIVTRPRIIGQEDLGLQMPLRVSRI